MLYVEQVNKHPYISSSLFDFPSLIKRSDCLTRLLQSPKAVKYRVFAFFQWVVSPDSAGVGVIAQHERHKPLSRLRHTSVTSVQSEERRGIHGMTNRRFISSEAEPSSLQVKHKSISQKWNVTKEGHIMQHKNNCYEIWYTCAWLSQEPDDS